MPDITLLIFCFTIIGLCIWPLLRMAAVHDVQEIETTEGNE
jgi:hypothetical protein